MSTYTQLLYQMVFGSKDHIPFMSTGNENMLFAYIAENCRHDHSVTQTTAHVEGFLHGGGRGGGREGTRAFLDGSRAFCVLFNPKPRGFYD